MANMTRTILAVFVFLWTLTGISAQPADSSWTFGSDGTLDYRLTVVSSTDLFSGALPADDPTINLEVGQRYQVTILDPVFHPLEVIAKGASSVNDTVLLAQGGTGGSFESDGGVAWVDESGGVVTFTMTADLLTAMQNGGRIPGYRCLNHPASMRGNFNVTAVQQDTPTPTETQPPTATLTNTTEPTATPTDTVEPSTTPTETLEPSHTPTATQEVTSTSTETPEPTATSTATEEPTPTDTATDEPTPTDTVEVTATPSETTVLPTATATNTPRSADLTGDGVVDSRDLLELMRQWHLQLK
jgi:hypothetical protein